MENYNSNQQLNDYSHVGTEVRPASKTFIANVFLWMFVALLVSAFVAFYFIANPEWLQAIAENGAARLIVIFAPLGFVMLMSLGFNKLSLPALIFCFIVYAAINGITFSFILLAYTGSSVVGCFLSAAAIFGIMAVMGYTTDKDLTSFGRILFMGLIGIVIAIVINMFLKSNQLGYIISIIGVMVFTGLTAYDVQKLKRIGAGIEYEGVPVAQSKKLSVMGALTLYLDFINLFLLLLRIFGNRRN